MTVDELVKTRLKQQRGAEHNRTQTGVSSELTVASSGGCGTVRSHEQECFNPEECCKYTMFSSEFNACCAEHGCCPIDCRSHTADAADSQLTQCGAWACCRFQENSPEFEQCCSEHGCCPLCSRVPSGCGFNMLMYKLGPVSEGVQRGCALSGVWSKTVTEEPFLTAEIVPSGCHNACHCNLFNGLLKNVIAVKEYTG
nr:uncharacterized protein LOC128701635 [Cherax quadricarinatus]